MWLSPYLSTLSLTLHKCENDALLNNNSHSLDFISEFGDAIYDCCVNLVHAGLVKIPQAMLLELLMYEKFRIFPLYIYLAETFTKQQHYVLSIQVYLTILHQQPNHIESILGITSLLMLLNKHNVAITFLESPSNNRKLSIICDLCTEFKVSVGNSLKKLAIHESIASLFSDAMLKIPALCQVADTPSLDHVETIKKAIEPYNAPERILIRVELFYLYLVSTQYQYALNSIQDVVHILMLGQTEGKYWFDTEGDADSIVEGMSKNKRLFKNIHKGSITSNINLNKTSSVIVPLELYKENSKALTKSDVSESVIQSYNLKLNQSIHKGQCRPQ